MDNRDHKKKMIAPVIITVVFIVYLAAYSVFIFMAASELSPVMILFAVPLIALGIGMVYVLKTRINEIRSGEEDDLSNY
ncbi:MAG: hypothetical protein IJJ50_00070 [Lachnospiraceae bacterium]|nr:hypothetical protein [Lachnospiraceae bacterium]